VADGDTLKIDGATYRLWGIDAPSPGNRAPTDDLPDGLPPNTRALSSATAKFPANLGPSIATAALSRFAAPIAATLGADMVADGHAWAFVRYSRDYVEKEREAAAVRARQSRLQMAVH
jgi:endonuclease YncB( thermonuclease family)